MSKSSSAALGGNPIGKPGRLILPEGKLGKLTPIKPAAGHRRFWHFRCDCGNPEVVIRELNQVRRAVRVGGVPACDLLIAS